MAVSVPNSKNPGSHWKVMTELSVGLVLVSNAPLSGGAGRTQVTIIGTRWYTSTQLTIHYRAENQGGWGGAVAPPV